MISVRNASDLITTKEDYKKGFSEIVVEKNLRMNPYISQSRSVQSHLNEVEDVPSLMMKSELHVPLLTAAGLSRKALNLLGMTDTEETVLIGDFIEAAVLPAGEDFRNEISLRYTLIQGDSFGGHMRNIIGSKAKLKLADAIVGCLLASGTFIRVKIKDVKNFIDYDPSNIRVNEISGISWKNNAGVGRILFFDKRCPIISKNVDVILLSSNEEDATEKLSSATSYLVCGELKGGIDPAGADEHWKTGNSAIIRTRLHADIKLFFVGAAIATSMAEEIFTALRNGELHMAANLNHEAQVSELGNWLASI